jgi:hypothetical protein
MVLTFDQILDQIENLATDDKEMLLDIIQKRMTQQRRKEIISDIRIGRKDYTKGNVKRGSSKDLMREISK